MDIKSKLMLFGGRGRSKGRKKDCLNENVQTSLAVSSRSRSRFSLLDNYHTAMNIELDLYDTLREAIPIIDAALLKIIRLIGGFKIECRSSNAQESLEQFCRSIQVGAVSQGLESFICTYLDNLLQYGNAVGEIVLDKECSCITALYNANLRDITIKHGDTALDIDICTKDENGQAIPIRNKERILLTALNPPAGSVYGSSILKGLPFVSSVLVKILESISSNFERVGNIRYAVSYKPGNDSMDKAYAKERAVQLAKEWSDGMNATRNGQITDFISVGDVSISVIGSDNQLIDTSVPVRQVLEQIVAKLGIPPFLLGLAWSTTERMSKQQSDILTSELEYYRRLLEPVILKICRTQLRLMGYTDEPKVIWDVINLQDEAEQARSVHYYAQAEEILKGLDSSNHIKALDNFIQQGYD